MKWQIKYNKLSKWHKWFAWHPVYIGNGMRVWLIWLYRVRICKMDGTPEGNCFYEYRELN